MKSELEREAGTEQNWTPSGVQDKKRVAAELKSLLHSPLFRRSERYSALLRHIVEKALEGKTADLKERIIGIEVFHRSSDYDTAADPVVRFCAGEVRKRLAQYYVHSAEALIEIELPIGSYIPLFRLRASAPHASGIGPEEGKAIVQEPDSALGNAEELPLPAEGVTTPGSIFSRMAVHKIQWRIALAALCVAAMLLVVKFGSRKDSVQEAWAPFLDKAVSVNICTGSPPPEGTAVSDSPDLSIEQHFLLSGHRVSIATAAAIADISGYLEGHTQPFDLSESDSDSLDNLRNRPLVLVNANNNQWTLLLQKSLRFYFDSQGHVGSILDRAHPEQRDWHIDFDQPYRQQTEDYAIVGRFFDKTINAPVFVIAGISTNGTKAAGEFSVSRRRLDDLMQGAPRGWEKMNFEAVLKVDVVQGRMGAVQVVAKNFW